MMRQLLVLPQPEMRVSVYDARPWTLTANQRQNQAVAGCGETFDRLVAGLRRP